MAGTVRSQFGGQAGVHRRLGHPVRAAHGPGEVVATPRFGAGHVQRPGDVAVAQLHDGEGHIAREWRFANGRGGWWPANLIDRNLPGSWQLTTSSAEPYIQRDGLNLDLRR